MDKTMFNALFQTQNKTNPKVTLKNHRFFFLVPVVAFERTAFL